MKNTIINTCFGLALCGSLLAGPAEDIAKKHAKATAAELEAYLKENPDAEDKDQAQQILLMSYNSVGETDKALAIFKDRFNSLESGANVNAGALYGATNTLFSLLMKDGKTDEAKSLTEEAIKKAVGNDREKELTNAFKVMQGQINKPKVGDTMEMKFTSLQGNEIDLASLKGKVVLIDFWATWCGPCVAEIPHLKKAYEKYHTRGFEIIGISGDQPGSKSKLEEFIKSKDLAWPQFYDDAQSPNKFAIKFGINSYPSTFLIGKDGKIIATNLRGPALEQALAKALPITVTTPPLQAPTAK